MLTGARASRRPQSDSTREMDMVASDSICTVLSLLPCHWFCGHFDDDPCSPRLHDEAIRQFPGQEDSRLQVVNSSRSCRSPNHHSRGSLPAPDEILSAMDIDCGTIRQKLRISRFEIMDSDLPCQLHTST